MQMDWTTFVLEIINFVVLVWLLQHFFYRPVLGVLDARQARVQGVKAAAEAMQRDAEALKTQYEARLTDWNKERELARKKLDEELMQERAKRLEALKQTLAGEEAKIRARNEAAAAAQEATLCRKAAAEAYGEAASLLQRLASPALTGQIVQVFCDDLAALGQADLDVLQQAVLAMEQGETVAVSSAHPLADADRQALYLALEKAAGRKLKVVFSEAPELIAGLRAAVGQSRLDANLADALAYFQRQGKHA